MLSVLLLPYRKWRNTWRAGTSSPSYKPSTTFSRKPWERVSVGSVGDLAARGRPGPGTSAEHVPPSSVEWPRSGYVNALLFLACSMWKHTPQLTAWVMGQGPCLMKHQCASATRFNGACLRSTPSCASSAATRAKELMGPFLSRPFGQTLGSSVAGRRLDLEGGELCGELHSCSERGRGVPRVGCWAGCSSQ